MQDIRIDGKLERVFMLRDEKDRMVFIRVKGIHRVDYERLKDMEKETSSNRDLLDVMKDTKLDNGRMALRQYDNIIQIANKQGEDRNTPLVSRVPKPEEVPVEKREEPKFVDQKPKEMEVKDDKPKRLDRRSKEYKELKAQGLVDY